jgi:predicted ribosomally synthesized peptide with SipW-like signal peptide
MRKIIFVGLALVLALGATGAAYAAWTDQVTITETVSTGEVLVGIADIGTDDDGPHGQPGDRASYFEPNLDPGWQNGERVQYRKNVASAISTNGDPVRTAAGEPTGFYTSVTETIDNGYPSYAPTVTIELANLGTIPVILSHIVQEANTGDTELGPFVKLVKWEALDEGGALMRSGVGWDELNAWLGSGLLQIEPGIVITLNLTKHIEQEDGQGNVCPEGKTITMTETLHFVQWNESHPDAPQ